VRVFYYEDKFVIVKYAGRFLRN